MHSTTLSSANTATERWWFYAKFFLRIDAKRISARDEIVSMIVSWSNTDHYTRTYRALATSSYEHFDINVTKHTKSIIHQMHPKETATLFRICREKKYTVHVSKLERNMASGNFWPSSNTNRIRHKRFPFVGTQRVHAYTRFFRCQASHSDPFLEKEEETWKLHE
jgi:hypothetical protein